MAIDIKKYSNKIKANLWSDKQFKVFYYNFTVNRKKYRGLIDSSTKVSWTKRDRIVYAETELNKIKKRRENSIVDDMLTLNTFFDKHIEHHEEGRWKEDKTNFYNYNVRNHYLGSMRISSVKPIDVKEVMKILKDRGLKDRSVSRVIEVLRPVFQEAIENGVIDINPLSTLKVKRLRTKKIVVNAVVEFKKIFDAIENEFFHDPFYKAFFAFAMQGRRRTEIMTLKWEDISFENNYYVLRDTKNNEEQKQFLSQRIKELLLEFHDPSKEYVFTSRYTGSHITSIQFQVHMTEYPDTSAV